MDHIEIKRLKIDDAQRRKGGYPRYDIPRRIFGDHGLSLQRNISDSITKAKTDSRTFSFNPRLVMKIELEDNVEFTDKEKEKLNLYNLRLIDDENGSIQVAFSEDIELTSFIDDLNKYKDGVLAKKKVVNEDLFGKIKSVLPWSELDRKCFDESCNNLYLDIYLWVFDTIQESKDKMSEFIDDLRSHNISVTDKYIGYSVVICRVRIEDASDIDVLLNHPLVYRVENIQTVNVISEDVSNIQNISISDLNFDTSSLNPDTASGICVIDSGIFQQHPLLRGVIGDSKTFFIDNTEVEDDSSDYSGHGTKVASICEYGNFAYDEEFVPTIYLFNAKIHNGEYTDPLTVFKVELEDKLGALVGNILDSYLLLCDKEIDIIEFSSCFPENQRAFVRMIYSKYISMYERLIPNQMKDIVEYFNGQYGCRVFNLSQGDSNATYLGDKPKAWACVLDELQNKNDILFVISAGNYIYSDSEIDDVVCNYPEYFFKNNECKIIEPSNSVSSITVGSMAISDETIRVRGNTLSNNVESITKTDYLSTFSRVGPGVNNSIKPDFVGYGGDYAIKQNILERRIKVNNQGTSKLVFGNDLDNIFLFDIGTSYAAPYVSHIAAKIVGKYPNISNNMIRCLLANSARYTPAVESLVNSVKEDASEIRREYQHNYRGEWINNKNKILHYSYGYGFPMIEDCLDSLNNKVVLMADMNSESDKISPNQVHIFRVPITEEFVNSSGTKRIKVSLAFNPKVRNTRLDYLGVNMDFKIIKGKSQEEIYQMFTRLNGENQVSIDGECETNPSSSLRSKGTLQKGIYEFKRATNFNEEDIFVVVSCKKKWDDSPQEYALVVGLETEENIDLYNVIRERVTIREHIRI
ncbi:S8 family peptidase [Clostridium sartagoforme]|uniref:S8 family peptidase n=1 Tax=Clostridium sartagoforme TaxID=84031 RepID=A0A4S2DP75_9CLOT|nr:S8 family peptidase [Clostridium sartagoforme]TGY42821.1 S8 family peptidase [Clostridium sartagoforme]